MSQEQMFLEMCINQGYVPQGCTTNGVVAWYNVNAGKHPCKDCRAEKCPVRVFPCEEAADD